MVHDTDGLGSGCVLCHEPDFLRGAFGDRTIIICDTCEREFHVGCLREHNRADLKEVRRWCALVLSSEYGCSDAQCGNRSFCVLVAGNHQVNTGLVGLLVTPRLHVCLSCADP